MTLPSSPNSISMSQVNTELGRASTAQISLNETAVRTLAGRSSGAIGMGDLRGKSSYTPMSGLGYVVTPTNPVIGTNANISFSWSGGTPPFNYYVTGFNGNQALISSSNLYTRSVSQSMFINFSGEAGYRVFLGDATGAQISDQRAVNRTQYINGTLIAVPNQPGVTFQGAMTWTLTAGSTLTASAFIDGYSVANPSFAWEYSINNGPWTAWLTTATVTTGAAQPGNVKLRVTGTNIAGSRLSAIANINTP